MAIDTGYAVPGEAIKFPSDIQERFVAPYERKLAREQEEQKYLTGLLEQRRIQNAKDLKDLLEFNPEVLRAEYQPHFSKKIRGFISAAQKAKRGSYIATDEEQSNVYNIKNDILKEVNMVNKLDQKVQGY